VKIAIATVSGPVDIDATVDGEWAVHRAPFDDRPNAPALKGWTVTHVPTGLAIPRALTSKRARDLMARLVEQMPTLGLPAKLITVQPVEASDLGPAYRKAVDLLVQVVNEACS